MIHSTRPHFTAFEGQRRLASGPLAEVALAVRMRSKAGGRRRSSSSTTPPAGRSISIFAAPSDEDRCAVAATCPGAGNRDRRDGGRGAARARPAETRRGRARGHAVAAALGMAGAQPGGASVALRKLVDEARRANGDRGSQPRRARRRLSFHVGHGRQPRRISRKPRARCSPTTGGGSPVCIAGWPDDIRDHVVKLAFSDRAEP